MISLILCFFLLHALRHQTAKQKVCISLERGKGGVGSMCGGGVWRASRLRVCWIGMSPIGVGYSSFPLVVGCFPASAVWWACVSLEWNISMLLPWIFQLLTFQQF